jgi:acetyltransferase-like isoleucine patch superfamily enzyme
LPARAPRDRLRSLLQRVYLRLLQAWDRARLARLARAHPGLEIDATASTNLASAKFELAPGARLRIVAGVLTERLPGRLVFYVGPGAQMEIGDGTWLRCEVEQIRLVAFEGARLELGRDCWLNGCQLSAKQHIEVAEGASIGPGSRVYDSDHALDEEHSERCAAVRIGEFSWVSSDVTVLRGVEIGSHCVIGSRSVVTRSIPSHSLAHGAPARTHGRVGRRRAFM